MNKSIVYVVMSADIIHSGHINILKIARDLSTKIDGEVVLGLLTDSAIASYKRVPYMNFDQRKMIAEGLRYIDRVIPQETLSYEKNIRLLKPRYVVHGDDWKSGVQQETRQNVINTLTELGCGELIEPQYTPNISSTILNNKIKKLRIGTEERLRLLPHIFASKKNVRFLNVFSYLSAKIGNLIREFDVFYLDLKLAKLVNGGKISEDSLVNILEKICLFSDRPLVCDLEYTDMRSTLQSVQRLERIGISGIFLYGWEYESDFAQIYRTIKQSQICESFLIFLHVNNNLIDIPNGVDGIIVEDLATMDAEERIILKTSDIGLQYPYIADRGELFESMIGGMLGGNQDVGEIIELLEGD